MLLDLFFRNIFIILASSLVLLITSYRYGMKYFLRDLILFCLSMLVLFADKISITQLSALYFLIHLTSSSPAHLSGKRCFFALLFISSLKIFDLYSHSGIYFEYLYFSASFIFLCILYADMILVKSVHGIVNNFFNKKFLIILLTKSILSILKINTAAGLLYTMVFQAIIIFLIFYQYHGFKHKIYDITLLSAVLGIQKLTALGANDCGIILILLLLISLLHGRILERRGHIVNELFFIFMAFLNLIFLTSDNMYYANVLNNIYLIYLCKSFYAIAFVLPLVGLYHIYSLFIKKQDDYFVIKGNVFLHMVYILDIFLMALILYFFKIGNISQINNLVSIFSAIKLFDFLPFTFVYLFWRVVRIFILKRLKILTTYSIYIMNVLFFILRYLYFVIIEYILVMKIKLFRIGAANLDAMLRLKSFDLKLNFVFLFFIFAFFLFLISMFENLILFL